MSTINELIEANEELERFIARLDAENSKLRHELFDIDQDIKMGRLKHIDNGDLIPGFIEAMREVCQHGYNKHKEKSFQAQVLEGNNRERRSERMLPGVFALHSREHFLAYLANIKHDHFNTFKHQLAAVAVNAMMEYYYANLDEE